MGFVNLMANVVEWAAPPPSDDDGPLPEATVLPVAETLLDPHLAIPGTVHGNFTERTPSEQPLWRLLIWLALGLVVGEGLLPWGKWIYDRVRPRASSRRKQASP